MGLLSIIQGIGPGCAGLVKDEVASAIQGFDMVEVAHDCRLDFPGDGIGDLLPIPVRHPAICSTTLVFPQ